MESIIYGYFNDIIILLNFNKKPNEFPLLHQTKD